MPPVQGKRCRGRSPEKTRRALGREEATGLSLNDSVAKGDSE